jgi:small subunit ribosomal protein S9
MPKTTKTKKTVKKKIKKPKKVEKAKAVKPVIKPKREKYFETEGRRKTAVARIRLFTRSVTKATSEKGAPDLDEKGFLVNAKPLQQYFPTFELQQTAQASLEKMKCLDKFRVSAKVKGGGLHAQAEAIRHGIARALVLFNPDFRKRLKVAGFLRRDPRMRERKKFGLKRARRAPQWQKR